MEKVIRIIEVILLIVGFVCLLFDHPIIASILLVLFLLSVVLFAFLCTAIQYGFDNKDAGWTPEIIHMPSPDEQNIQDSSEQFVEDSTETKSDVQ